MAHTILTRQLLANVRRIELRTRKIVDQLTAGAYHSVFKGRGIEFNEVRDYIPGDDVRIIDWNVTARFARPFVKKFTEERELSVMLLVDISASGDFGSGNKSKSEQAAELAALLALSAVRNDDRVGLLMFTSDSEIHLPPRKGRRHVLRILRELLVQSRRKRQTDIDQALQRALRVMPRRSIVFLISDMVDRGYEKTLTIAGHRHDVIVMRITDPLELRFPGPDYFFFEDAESAETGLFNGGREPECREQMEEVNKKRAATEAACRRAHVDLIDILVGQKITIPLMKFFQSRRKRR